MSKEDELRELCGKLCKELKSGEELEIIYFSTQECLTRFANNVITQNIEQKENAVTLRLKKGKKVLNLTSNSVNFEPLKNLIKRGRDTIEYINDVPDLPDLSGPQEYKRVPPPDTKIVTFGPEDRASIVGQTISISIRNDCEANGTVSNKIETLFIGNSNNLYAYFENAFFTYRYIPKYKDVTSFNSFSATSLEKFNIEKITQHAIELAKQGINPQEAEEGTYTVIFSGDAVANFLEFLTWFGFNTKNIYEKSTVLWDKLNQKIFSELVTMYDDYQEEDFIGMPFDIEGTPRKKITLVENGVFKEIPLSKKYAKLLNKEYSTGHNFMVEPNIYGVFPVNLIIKNGRSSLDNMIKNTENGLYVHNLHYCNAIDQYNILMTGLTRFGVFKIKNGKLAYPVKNMRFTESISNVFNRVAEIGSESQVTRGFFGMGFKTPPIKVEGFNFSSKTLF